MKRALGSWLLALGLRPRALGLLLLAACCLPLAACRPLTPAEHVRNLRGEVELVRLGCVVYVKKTELPRDPVLDRDCAKLVTP